VYHVGRIGCRVLEQYVGCPVRQQCLDDALTDPTSIAACVAAWSPAHAWSYAAKEWSAKVNAAAPPPDLVRRRE
jgi:hypothetical protein